MFKMLQNNRDFNSKNVICEQPIQRSAHFWYRNNFFRMPILDFATLGLERNTDDRT